MRTSAALPSPQPRRASLPRPAERPSPSIPSLPEVAETSPAPRLVKVGTRPLPSPTPPARVEKEETPRPPRRRAQRSDTGSIKITPRDVTVLTYLLRYRYATPAHCAVLTGSTVRAMEVRLRTLRRHGLVAAQKAAWGLEVVWGTSVAVEITGVDLDAGKANPALATLEHTLTIAYLGALIESGAMGAVDDVPSTTVTETEIRRALYRLQHVDRVDPWSDAALPHDARTNPARLAEHPHACVVRQPALPDRIPDLVLVNPDGTRARAIEVEKSRKTPRDLQRILRGYVHSDLYTDVLYQVPENRDGIARLVQETADAVGFAAPGAPGFAIRRHNAEAWHSAMTAPTQRR